MCINIQCIQTNRSNFATSFSFSLSFSLSCSLSLCRSISIVSMISSFCNEMKDLWMSVRRLNWYVSLNNFFYCHTLRLSSTRDNMKSRWNDEHIIEQLRNVPIKYYELILKWTCRTIVVHSFLACNVYACVCVLRWVCVSYFVPSEANDFVLCCLVSIVSHCMKSKHFSQLGYYSLHNRKRYKINGSRYEIVCLCERNFFFVFVLPLHLIFTLNSFSSTS